MSTCCTFHLCESLEKTNLICTDRKQSSSCLGPEEDGDWLEMGIKEYLGDKNVFYLKCVGGYMGRPHWNVQLKLLYFIWIIIQ